MPSATLTPRTFEEETRRMAERDNSSKNDEIESAKGQLLEDADNEGTKEATEEAKEKQFDKKKCFSWEASKANELERNVYEMIFFRSGLTALWP